MTDASPRLHEPVAIFDAGIGSYAVVEAVRRRLPAQDVLYFADRASFPYGAKSADELLAIMKSVVRFLEGFDPSAIVMASNAPSVMVLEELRPFCRAPLFGVFPPVDEALRKSRSGLIGVMGVRSMIESAPLRRYVEAHAGAPKNVSLIDGSPMVELVESGAFLFDPEGTGDAVARFTNAIFEARPGIDVLTLSSTHLPWLRQFFEAVAPDCLFLDPAEAVVAGLGAGVAGSGSIRALVTETETYDLATFRAMLGKIGVELPLEAVPALKPI